MADEILGISGHFDLSDIQRSIDELINGLDKIGVKTDVLSKRMNDAMKAEFVMMVMLLLFLASSLARSVQHEPASIMIVSPECTVSAARSAILCFVS